MNKEFDKLKKAGEIITEYLYDNNKVLRYVITNKQSNGMFFLYEVNGDVLNKLGKVQSPLDFEEKFKMRESLLENRH